MREQTLGVVDIGSNTVHLLVARTNGRSLVPLVDVSEGLQLGGDVDYDGVLSVGKLKELLSTLSAFRKIAAEAGVSTLHLLATQAIRMAANKDEICQAITKATTLRVEVLTPEQEAAFSFAGADADCPSIGPQVVVDIGGGSMQVAIGLHGDVWDSVSLPLGAARVVNQFLPSDPPTYLEEARLVSYLASVIPPALPLPDTTVTGIIGVGGTLRRMPALIDTKNGQPCPADALERILTSVARQDSSRNISGVRSKAGTRPPGRRRHYTYKRGITWV